jgi:hypothetical protein
MGGTKWVVFDVDDSPTSATEMHEILEDVNHHIALTTDSDNPYKYRILVELDSPVEVSDKQWKHFVGLIAFDLGIKCDLLPKAQFYIGWNGREVLSVVDKSSLTVKGYLDSVAREETKIIKRVSGKEKESLISDSRHTFWYAYEADPGKKRALFKLAMHAYDLGLTFDETLEIINDVKGYWAEEINKVWFEGFLSQIRRKFNIEEEIVL